MYNQNDGIREEYNATYHLSDREKNIHRMWDNSLDPILTVEDGDIIRFECRDALDSQIDVQSSHRDFITADRTRVHPLTGPVAIEDAEPGDVLKVNILELQHKGWGFTGYLPAEEEMGLLPKKFEDPKIHIWELNDGVGKFANGIEVPLNPFPGIIGVAPAENGEHSTLPPRSVGGNMDIKHLTAGSTVYLPIKKSGALFSIGDCHAAQGDGEVCLTGIEAPMFVTVRVTIEKDRYLSQPQFRSEGPYTPSGTDEPMYGTTGISNNLMEATKKAVWSMIQYLSEKRNLSRGEAYILCSAIADLKINQVVDQPNWTVSAYLPEGIFPDEDQM